MCGLYSECLKELVKTDETAVVLVEFTKQLIDFCAGHAHSEVSQTVRQFFAVESATSIVVDHAKRSASAIIIIIIIIIIIFNGDL